MNVAGTSLVRRFRRKKGLAAKILKFKNESF
jgi:hypothetical protein